MYEKYGFFETADELNKKAAELRGEGKYQEVKELAKENGIEEEIADFFCEGEVEGICDDEIAAIGRIDVETEKLQPQEIFKDWIEYIKACVCKDKNMAKAVRKEGKSIEGCISNIMIWSFKNAYDVPKEIIKEAQKDVKDIPGKVKMGVPGMGTAKKLIKEYYLG